LHQGRDLIVSSPGLLALSRAIQHYLEEQRNGPEKETQSRGRGGVAQASRRRRSSTSSRSKASTKRRTRGGDAAALLHRRFRARPVELDGALRVLAEIADDIADLFGTPPTSGS
jgi:hypothetical protein